MVGASILPVIRDDRASPYGDRTSSSAREPEPAARA
jgi:hypothetical protein